MDLEISNVKRELQSGRFVIISTSGVSMQPLLYDKKKKKATQVLVEPVSVGIKKGSLPLFEYGKGRLVIHRLINIYPDGSIKTRGDNCIGCEYIKRENIYGIVTQIYRNNRTIKVTDKSYKMYVQLWNLIFPLRYIYYRSRIILSKVKRHVLHKAGRY